MGRKSEYSWFELKSFLWLRESSCKLKKMKVLIGLLIFAFVAVISASPAPNNAAPVKVLDVTKHEEVKADEPKPAAVAAEKLNLDEAKKNPAEDEATKDDKSEMDISEEDESEMDNAKDDKPEMDDSEDDESEMDDSEDDEPEDDNSEDDKPEMDDSEDDEAELDDSQHDEHEMD